MLGRGGRSRPLEPHLHRMRPDQLAHQETRVQVPRDDTTKCRARRTQPDRTSTGRKANDGPGDRAHLPRPGHPCRKTRDWPQATLTELRAKIGTWPRPGPRGEYNPDPPANSKQQHAARAGRTRITTLWNIPRQLSTGKFKTLTRHQICNKVEPILCDQNLQPTQAHPSPTSGHRYFRGTSPARR